MQFLILHKLLKVAGKNLLLMPLHTNNLLVIQISALSVKMKLLLEWVLMIMLDPVDASAFLGGDCSWGRMSLR